VAGVRGLRALGGEAFRQGAEAPKELRPALAALCAYAF
jgi:hypothetical protein